jgi:hypothetical protein
MGILLFRVSRFQGWQHVADPSTDAVHTEKYGDSISITLKFFPHRSSPSEPSKIDR